MQGRGASFWLALLAAGGCAQGGRGPSDDVPDAGSPRDAFVVVPMDAGDRTDGGSGGIDAGPDAGPRLVLDSGGRDAGCTSAMECSDGLVCNGSERCEGGRCVAGTPVVCDDGVACTTDRCTEPAAACEYVPDDTMCAAGESCNATLGCRAGCTETPCKLVAPQCGCPAGQGCYIDGTGARLCAMAGVNAQGAACSGTTSCTAGNLCVNIDRAGGSTGSCLHFCSSDTHCGGGICFYELDDGAGGVLTGVRLCTQACNPVTQTGCRAGAYCDVFREPAGAMRYFTDCTAPPMGAGVQGSPCTTVDQCASGYTCADPGTGNECMKWCNVTTGSGCSGGRTCIGFSPAITVGTTEYGVCF